MGSWARIAVCVRRRTMPAQVFTGLDRLAAREREAVSGLVGRRVGLLAHPASVDRHLRHAHEVLREVGVEVVALFGPEHGFGGSAQDMVTVEGERAFGVPVYSLYGDSEA